MTTKCSRVRKTSHHGCVYHCSATVTDRTRVGDPVSRESESLVGERTGAETSIFYISHPILFGGRKTRKIPRWPRATHKKGHFSGGKKVSSIHSRKVYNTRTDYPHRGLRIQVRVRVRNHQFRKELSTLPTGELTHRTLTVVAPLFSRECLEAPSVRL